MAVVVYRVGGGDVANLVTKVRHGIDSRERLPVRWMLRQDVLGLCYVCIRVRNDKHLYHFSVRYGRHKSQIALKNKRYRRVLQQDVEAPLYAEI
jgi:hypothetical protein